MLREEKNKEYASQIYFALGSLALKDKNDTLALSRFQIVSCNCRNKQDLKKLMPHLN